MTVSRDEVIWAYRMILGREPESEQVIAEQAEAASLDHLRSGFMASAEFQTKKLHRLDALDTDERDRIDRVREFVSKEQVGIEIGPWFNPLCPKAEGYRSLTLDVFDQEELKARARNDTSIPAEAVDRIEVVDFVGSVSGLEDLVGARDDLRGNLDYVISSHNFEHIPDPIRFLQACGNILKPGGVLSMALPDRRTCFDHFRPHTVTGDMLGAFWEKRMTPSPAQIFSHVALHAKNRINGVDHSGWGIDMTPANVNLQDNIKNAYDAACRYVQDTNAPYFDAHCWTFTPTSLQVIIADLQALGLIKLSIKKLVVIGGHEFYIHLVNEAGESPDPTTEAFREKRSELLRQVNDEAAVHSRLFLATA